MTMMVFGLRSRRLLFRRFYACRYVRFYTEIYRCPALRKRRSHKPVRALDGYDAFHVQARDYRHSSFALAEGRDQLGPA